MENEMKAFFTGMFVGMMLLIGVAVTFLENPRALVRQGWFSIGDKVYTVTPAEVVARKEESK